LEITSSVVEMIKQSKYGILPLPSELKSLKDMKMGLLDSNLQITICSVAHLITISTAGISMTFKRELMREHQ